MSEILQVRSALISVFHKQGLEPLVQQLVKQGVICYSTGGTADYLRGFGATVVDVADLTGYPSILGGRVKTLHPKVHGGILARRAEAQDRAELEKFEIPTIDLVVVDLYPFEATVEKFLAREASEEDVIEKIDIGGIALIRGAAKNFDDVVIVPSAASYAHVADLLTTQGGTTLAQRRALAGVAFGVSSAYDSAINRWFVMDKSRLRYGENPHQQGFFYGDLDATFEKIQGKELSYNNLVDIDGALALVDEFTEPCYAIIKHTNPCGVATGATHHEAWLRALESDPVSAFGGIIATNGIVTKETAEEINKLFFEVLVAEGYDADALPILQSKKNRILLRRKTKQLERATAKSLLNGTLVQDKDTAVLTADQLQPKTSRLPSETEVADALFGDKVVKHLKSNAIAIVKNGQLIGSGVGQTSRIDALKQAIAKAAEKGFSLEGAVLASDAFFPFSDSVAMAHEAGIQVVVEPGGSVRDDDTISYCEENNLCLLFTGIRHFKH